MVPVCIRLTGSTVRHEYQHCSKHFLIFILKLGRIEILKPSTGIYVIYIDLTLLCKLGLVIIVVNLVDLYKPGKACSCSLWQPNSCSTSFQSRICILLRNRSVVPSYILKQLNCPLVSALLNYATSATKVT